MITTILTLLLALSSFLAVKWKIENNILMDECADCIQKLNDSAENTYKNEYVDRLKAENERLKNYLLNHNPLEL